MASHVDERTSAVSEEVSETTQRQQLDAVTSGWRDSTKISVERASDLVEWLDDVLPSVEEGNATEEGRVARLNDAAKVSENKDEVLKLLYQRLPVFVYFSNYFRVRPRFHLGLLADRLEQNILDDDQYDRGNACLLKLLGFNARELSNLGRASEPGAGDLSGLKAYQDQLDRRSYRLNAASIRLTESINKVWQPDPKRAEADRLRVEADQQYLKVVVEDELGVEVELDQRSEGYQWLVSFFRRFLCRNGRPTSECDLAARRTGLEPTRIETTRVLYYRF